MRTHPAVADIGALTRLMLERHVEFILVEGAAAVAHGSPTSTRDYELDLPTLIEVKTAAGRPKDKIVVAGLLAILDRKTRT